MTIAELQHQIHQFETKWAMTFAEFSRCIEEKSLDVDAYAYGVEQDFWAWEEAVTLFAYYQSFQPELTSALTHHPT